MARGQKYGDEIREKAYALLAVNNNLQTVASELGLPYTTVRTWRNQWMKDEASSEPGVSSEGGVGESELAKLRNRKRAEFADKAWRFIDTATNLLERRLQRAVEQEDALDKILDEILQLDRSDLNEIQRKALCNRISMLKLESTKELTTIIGTLYDKQALANKEATSIIDGSIVTRKFEDF